MRKKPSKPRGSTLFALLDTGPAPRCAVYAESVSGKGTPSALGFRLASHERTSAGAHGPGQRVPRSPRSAERWHETGLPGVDVEARRAKDLMALELAAIQLPGSRTGDPLGRACRLVRASRAQSCSWPVFAESRVGARRESEPTSVRPATYLRGRVPVSAVTNGGAVRRERCLKRDVGRMTAAALRIGTAFAVRDLGKPGRVDRLWNEGVHPGRNEERAR